jgi:DNA repair exonuclease SbcCD nuclease subunit
MQSSVEFAQHMSDLDKPNIWITGNHDVVEDARGSHTLMGVKGLQTNGKTLVADHPLLFALADPRKSGRYVGVACLPFVAPSNSYDPSEAIRIMKEEESSKAPIRIVIAHLNIEGITPGSETKDMARGRDVYLPIDLLKETFPKAQIWNGHYHEQQTFNGVHIPGSLLRLTHGEEHHNPGFALVDL